MDIALDTVGGSLAWFMTRQLACQCSRADA
jgi:hypothetical protein